MNKTKIDNYYKPESKTLRLDEIVYTMIPNSDIKPLLDKLQQENKQLKDNWNILKEFIDTLWLDNKGIVTNIKDKIELIEQGSDNK